MAGDEHSIYIYHNSKVIDEFTLGKLRNNNIFCLDKYKYNDKYTDTRLSKGRRTTFSILSLETINEIQKLLDIKPITIGEKEEYERIQKFIEFVNDYANSKYEIVFCTLHD